jgi:pantothenate kinase
MLLLTKYKNVNKAIERGFDYGDSSNVDMTVGDIYGSNVESLGIPANLLASSMGKASKDSNEGKYNDLDILKSLLFSIAVNIG